MDRIGNKTNYSYDQNGNLIYVDLKSEADQSLANLFYEYDQFGNIKSIFRGDGQQYDIKQDEFRNLESIGISGKPEKLISYDYKKGTGRLKSMTYANGDVMKATYNSIGQMIAEKWYDKENVQIAYYKYTYDGAGNIVRSIDILHGKEYNYYYEKEALSRSVECAVTFGEEDRVIAKTLLSTVFFEYDKEGALIKKKIVPAQGEVQTVFFEGTDGDASVLKISVGDKNIVAQAKNDSFGRKVFDELQVSAGFVSRQFSYHSGMVTEEHKESKKLKSSPISHLVSRITFSDDRTIDYEYDAEERITKVTDSVDGVTEYTYDALGQLLTETLNGVAVNVMTYDNYGNIRSKNGKNYAYNNVLWNDLLTSYDGDAIFCDAQGNPINYRSHSLSWEKGRQLKVYDDVEFFYNANGIRTAKKIFDLEHVYTLEGAKILRETWGENTLIPLYDGEESVCGIVYNGDSFYFQKNLQGDIVAIFNQEAELVVRYSYDAWGVCKIKSDISGCNIANINPFRYRGYYYDNEMELYYLCSRYYDPVVGRFLNGDEPMLINDAERIGGYNLFSYCENKTTYCLDPDGYVALFLYGKDQQNDAKKIERRLSQRYLVESKKITSNSQFAKKWNQFASSTYSAADIVIINLHGNPREILHIDMNNLKRLSINLLIILSCNAGHLNWKNNIAMQFFKRHSIQKMICCDGSHTRLYNFYDTRLVVSNTSSFREWIKRSSNRVLRKSKGFLYYQKNRSGKTVYRSVGKSFSSIASLLKKVGRW